MRFLRLQLKGLGRSAYIHRQVRGGQVSIMWAGRAGGLTLSWPIGQFVWQERVECDGEVVDIAMTTAGTDSGCDDSPHHKRTQLALTSNTECQHFLRSIFLLQLHIYHQVESVNQ